MGKNKTALQANNTDLASIKQTLQNLPVYENLTEDLDAQEGIITSISDALVGKVSEANATAEDILEGKKAYVGKNLITGVYNPATADPDLIPENIREGVDIFGIIGSLGEGLRSESGTITLASGVKSITVTHGLGAEHYAFFISVTAVTSSQGQYKNKAIFFINGHSAYPTRKNAGALFTGDGYTDEYIPSFTPTSITIAGGSSYGSVKDYWCYPVSYIWTAVALD